MPTKQLEDWTKIKFCRHPEHRPPRMQVFKPGSYEHICPGCGARSYFTVPLITLKTLLCSLVLLVCSCTDETSSRRALENEGYENIHFTGYSPFSCSDDDTYKTGFTATKPKQPNAIVSGTVCCGILKGCTIRY